MSPPPSQAPVWEESPSLCPSGETGRGWIVTEHNHSPAGGGRQWGVGGWGALQSCRILLSSSAAASDTAALGHVQPPNYRSINTSCLDQTACFFIIEASPPSGIITSQLLLQPRRLRTPFSFQMSLIWILMIIHFMCFLSLYIWNVSDINNQIWMPLWCKNGPSRSERG